MTKRDVLSVALKVLGAWCIVHSLSFLLTIGISLQALLRSSQGDVTLRPMLIWGSVGFVLVLCAAYILLRFGDGIARRLAPIDSELSALGPSAWEKPVFVLSLRIIGVVCLVRGIPQLVRPIATLVLQGRYATLGNLDNWASLIAAIVYLLLGAYLLSGGKHLVAWAYPEKAQVRTSTGAP